MKAMNLTPSDLLEASLKERLRGYAKKTDIAFGDDPLGVFRLTEKDVDVRSQKDFKKLMDIKECYKAHAIGCLCNDILNHKDFDLYGLYKDYMAPSGASSFAMSMPGVYIIYLESGFNSLNNTERFQELGKKFGREFGDRIVNFRNNEGITIPYIFTRKNYANTYNVEFLNSRVYTTDFGIFVAMKENELNPKFFSKYKIIYRKSLLQELKDIRFLFDNTLKVCRIADQRLVKAMEVTISAFEYNMNVFLEKIDATVRPETIRRILDTCYNIRLSISRHIEKTGKFYSRFTGEGIIATIPSLVELAVTNVKIIKLVNEIKKEEL